MSRVGFPSLSCRTILDEIADQHRGSKLRLQGMAQGGNQREDVFVTNPAATSCSGQKIPEEVTCQRTACLCLASLPHKK